jgi:hypothetical protein
MVVMLTLLLATVIAASVTTYESELDQTVPVQTAAVNPWSGAIGDLIRLSNTEAGATDVSARINFTIQSGSNTVGNSLNSVYIEVTTSPSPDMFSETEQSDLQKVAVDENSDGSIDQVITGDVNGWQVQNGGSAVKIELSGSAYTADAGDSIIVEFDDVQNPNSAGTYDLRAQTSGDGNWHYGTIDIT